MVHCKLDLLDESARSEVEADLWVQAKQLLNQGSSVILITVFGGAKSDRYRLEAQQLGFKVKLHYLDVPLDEFRRRIQAGKQDRRKYGVQLTRQQLENAAKWIEPTHHLKNWLCMTKNGSSTILIIELDLPAYSAGYLRLLQTNLAER